MIDLEALHKYLNNQAVDNAFYLGKAEGYKEAMEDTKAYTDASFRNRMLERIDNEMENCDNCPGFDEGVYFGLMTARQIICEEMGTPESEQVKSS